MPRFQINRCSKIIYITWCYCLGLFRCHRFSIKLTGRYLRCYSFSLIQKPKKSRFHDLLVLVWDSLSPLLNIVKHKMICFNVNTTNAFFLVIAAPTLWQWNSQTEKMCVVNLFLFYIEMSMKTSSFSFCVFWTDL